MIKVLYVDDDESFCGFFKIYLEKNEDIIVTTVQSGLAALEMVLSGSHDIVISDYSMPGMSVWIFRAMRREGVQIPFILFTGKGEKKLLSKLLTKAQHFICKRW
jgi:CheY-like chemotaxis protein